MRSTNQLIVDPKNEIKMQRNLTILAPHSRPLNHSQPARQLQERATHVLTALDSFCTPDQQVSCVQVLATLDKTAAELCKDLKKQVPENSTPPYQNYMPQKTSLKGDLDDEKDKRDLFLFRPASKDKMMAFTRLQLQTFPLRLLNRNQVPAVKEIGQLPDFKQGETLLGDLTREKAFALEQMLAFVSRSQIERYLKAYQALYRQDKSENAVVNSLSKAIMSNSKSLLLYMCSLRAQGQTKKEESKHRHI